MSAENYGYFSQFYVAISIFILLLGMGLTVSFTYYIGQGRIDNKRAASALTRLDGLCLVAIIIAVAGILFYPSSKTLEAVWYGLIVSAFFVRGINLPSIYLGRQKITSYNFSLLLRPACIAVAVGTWALFSTSLEALYIYILFYAVVGYFVSYGLSHIEFSGQLNLVNVPVSNARFLGYGVIALLSNLSYVVGQRGFVYLLGSSISPKQAGVFFMFLALLEVLLLVPSAIGLYFFSRASAGSLKKKDVILCVGLALGMFLLANLVFYIARLVGQSYSILPENYIELLRLMVLSVPLQVCMLFLKIFSQVACGYGLVRLTMYGSIVGGIISIGAGYFLVNTYQINGAVFALFFGNLLNILLVGSGLFICIRKRKNIERDQYDNVS